MGGNTLKYVNPYPIMSVLNNKVQPCEQIKPHKLTTLFPFCDLYQINKMLIYIYKQWQIYIPFFPWNCMSGVIVLYVFSANN